MHTPTFKRSRALGGAALAALAVAACTDDRTLLFEHVGPVAYNFNLVSAGAALPAGAVSVAATPEPTLRVRLNNLAPLASGVYQVWLADSALGTVRGAVGRIVAYAAFVDENGVTHRDSAVLATADSTFNAPATMFITSADTAIGRYDSLRVVVVQSGLGVDPRPPSFYIALVTIEAAAVATPGSSQFLWRRIGRAGAAGGAGALTFGNFGGETPAADTVFPGAATVAGSGRGGFRGDEVMVNMSGLFRPPVGFAYEGWLVGPTDTVRVGDITSGFCNQIQDPGCAYRVSLRDADSDASLPNLGATVITSCNIQGFASEIGLSGEHPYQPFTTLRVSLTPKAAGSLAPSFIFSGAVPDLVQNPPEQ